MGRIADALAKAERERKKLHRSAQGGTHILTSVDVSGIDPHLVSYTAPRSTISEQYRMLRTNLLGLNSTRPIQALVVTSAIKKEGKTVTVLNLAIAIATDQEKKAIAIDCDLRRPTMHSLLGMNGRPGLSEFLRGNADLQDVIRNTAIPNLTIIPAGAPPTNPSELIGSKKMRNLIQELRTKFDYLIFDTPPVMAVTDAGVLGPMLDGVVLVIKAHSTKRNVVLRAESLLKSAKATLLGCVLTNIREFSPYYIYTEK
jgi:capsular exopolysaccharide synthesis family protein